MKKLKFIFLFVLLAGIAACSSDDDNKEVPAPSGSGSFTYDGKTYNIKSGIVDNEGIYWSDDGSTEYEFSLITSKLSIDPIQGFVPEEEKISVINFNLFSQNASKPKTGEYNLDWWNNVDYTVEEASVVINLSYTFQDGDLVDFDYDEDVEAESGKVNIHKSGNVYELDFDFTMENGKQLTGEFKGKMLSIEFEEVRPAGKGFFQALKAKLKELRK